MFLWGLASVGLMVLGAIGPWVSIRGVVVINGTDDGHDGWVVIGAAAIGGLALLLWRKARSWSVLAVLAGGVSLATTIYDRIDLERTVDGIDVGQFLDPAWGIYVAMIGSASLAAAAVASWIVSGKGAQTSARV